MPSHAYDFREHLPQRKFSKQEVSFEHPAKGKDHCSQCRHWEKPKSCEIVAGDISAADWCKEFLAKERK